jgi:hypothetical protein
MVGFLEENRRPLTSSMGNGMIVMKLCHGCHTLDRKVKMSVSGCCCH